MATSLDEAVEQLFVGWTPAPPAPDHASYESSPNPCVHHCIHKSSAHSRKSVLRLLKAYQQALRLLLSHLQPTKQLIRVHVTAGVSGTVRLTAALPLLRRPARAAVEMQAGSPLQLGMLIN